MNSITTNLACRLRNTPLPMGSRLHLIERMNLWERAGRGRVRTGYWRFTPKQATSMLGMKLLLHRNHSAAPHLGGRIISYEIQDHGEFKGRIVFTLETQDCAGETTSEDGWTRWWKCD